MALLEAKEISRNFGGLKAVDNVSLSLEEKRITGLIGPNGAGKTTMFNMLTGFLTPDKGKIYYRSRDITGMPPYRLVSLGIARSWQGVRLFYELPAIDNVLMAIPHQTGENALLALFTPFKLSSELRSNVEKALSYLEFVKLTDKAGEIVANLSYAEQKLLSVARLLATEASLLLLDEPMSGIDLNTMQKIMFPLIHNLVEQKGKTVCIVEHNLDVVKACCDWVHFMDQGKLIAQGPPAEIMTNPELGHIYFGTR